MSNAFIVAIAPAAVRDARESGVLASLTIAQAALESDWGRSSLARDGKNLFGIKGVGEAGSGLYWTREYSGGEWIRVQARFRHYHDWIGSIRDHSQLLQKPRYRRVVGAGDYRTACREIEAAGYATDPGYAEKLIDLIEHYKLHQYDEEAVDVVTVKDGEGKVVGYGERRQDGVSWVPVRTVCEALGAQVHWDEATRTVTIVKPA